MRLTTTLTELTDEDWTTVQGLLRPSYDIKPGATRVCLTVVHGAEERHAELPLGTFVETLAALALGRTVRNALTALAALSPDTLPDVPEIECKCGFRAPELGPHPECPSHSLKCGHGTAVVREDPSAFEGAEPVRLFADGCQSYGPYANETGEVDK